MREFTLSRVSPERDDALEAPGTSRCTVRRLRRYAAAECTSGDVRGCVSSMCKVFFPSPDKRVIRMADVSWECNIPKNLFIVPAITWRDIQRLLNVLNQGDETYAPLRRCEGGFNCLSGPNFISDEPENGVSEVRDPVRKAIRFKRGAQDMWNWPSDDHSFENAKPDDVIFKGGEVVEIGFEGQNCPKWTKKRCAELCEIICRELRWKRIKKNQIYTRMRRLFPMEYYSSLPPFFF